MAAARRQFGNLGVHHEDRHETRTINWLENLWRDVRYGVRQLRHNPLFTTVAIATLAIGIGANTAVFTLLDQLVLRLLPGERSIASRDDLARRPELRQQQRTTRAVSYPFCQDLRKSPALESVMCAYNTSEAVTIDGSDREPRTSNSFPEIISTRSASNPPLGRVFHSPPTIRFGPALPRSC